MPLPVYPSLPGRGIDIQKAPVWMTRVQKAWSGLEDRTSQWSYPLWEITLQYDVLRNKLAQDELNTLWGFYNLRQGSRYEFLFEDPEDTSVSGGLIGVGNGVLTSFQLTRKMGAWLEPFRDIKGAPVVYLDGVVQASGWSLSDTGQIVFSAPVATGKVVSADFSFYFRVRFFEDRLIANRFALNLWEMGQVILRSVK